MLFRSLQFTDTGLITGVHVLSIPQTLRSNELKSSQAAKLPSDIANARGRRCERAYVDLEAVYPNESTEYCFEELRAIKRGWTQQQWKLKAESPLRIVSGNVQRTPEGDGSKFDDIKNITKEMQNVHMEDKSMTMADPKPPKQKRIKVREVKQETQTGEGHV